jgi:nicotinamide riboside kinase
MNVVVADAPPLMAALYADLLHNDQTRYAFALAQHQIYDLTLVCGLDIPCSKSKQQDAGSLPREAVDARLRAVLARGGSAYAVIYGQGPARMDAAIKTISSLQSKRFDSSAKNPKRWQWACEKCSDPECEQRMFTGQLNMDRQ